MMHVLSVYCILHAGRHILPSGVHSCLVLAQPVLSRCSAANPHLFSGCGHFSVLEVLPHTASRFLTSLHMSQLAGGPSLLLPWLLHITFTPRGHNFSLPRTLPRALVLRDGLYSGFLLSNKIGKCCIYYILKTHRDS